MFVLIEPQRVKNNLSQEKLGNLIGVSRQTINAIENGRVQPTVLVALKMSRIFKMPIEKLFELEPHEEPNQNAG